MSLLQAGLADNALTGTPLIDPNLKTRAALGKPQLFAVPPVALMALGAAMEDGAKKYGLFNWRETGATSSVFYDAMQRHLMNWREGENFASDSRLHHLAHLMAGAAIVLDAEACGILNDNRPKEVRLNSGYETKYWRE